jgi:hypothetical protein
MLELIDRIFSGSDREANATGVEAKNFTGLPGGNSEREPPDPIPNSEVKTFCADGSVAGCHARVGHCQASHAKSPDTRESVGALFVWAELRHMSGVPCFMADDLEYDPHSYKYSQLPVHRNGTDDLNATMKANGGHPMKYAVRTLLTILGAVGLCSCESLPSTDSFDRGGYVPSRADALSHTYHGFRNELGADGANIEKLGAYYSPNW